jgi:hypothetical protein
MDEFTTYTLEEFNTLFDTDIKQDDNFNEAVLKIENAYNSYFYVSMCDDDVLDAIKDEN